MNHSTTARMAAAAVFATAILSAPTASAAPPSGPADIFYELDAGLGCSFPLTVSGTDSKRHTKEFLDENGLTVRIIEAGKGFNLTYTNETTLQSIYFAGNGSVTQTRIDTETNISTVTATGNNGLILFPTDIPEGPTAVQYVGRIVYTVDAAGIFTLQSTSGTSVDICAALD
ncbi:MAG TPA: hypothetical protein VF885_11265 [Arthrobacter sp.]